MARTSVHQPVRLANSRERIGVPEDVLGRAAIGLLRVLGGLNRGCRREVLRAFLVGRRMPAPLFEVALGLLIDRGLVASAPCRLTLEGFRVATAWDVQAMQADATAPGPVTQRPPPLPGRSVASFNALPPPLPIRKPGGG
jgi:hypothetical protein